MTMVSRIRIGCAALLLAFAAAACDTVPLTAPSGSTLTISAASTIVPSGGTTEVTAFVAEEGGIAVQNGTSVRFTTNLGRMEPPEAQTRNGYAVSTFVAGDSAGVAVVNASSGGIGAGTTTAPAPPSTGNGTPTTTPTPTATGSSSVQITVGAAASETVVLNASATSVPSGGGTVTLIASVMDINGNRLRNTPINFSTTAGSLSATVATTDASGEARVDLTTNRNATVTARAATKSATLEVTVSTPATILLGADPSSLPVGGGTVTLTALVQDADGNRLANVPVSFSTSTGMLSATLATTNANGEARVELTTKTTATVTARAANLERTTTVNVDTGTAATPANVTLVTSSPTVRQGGTVELTASVFDASGNRLPNVQVSFSAISGSGTFSPNPARTNDSGNAQVTFTASSTTPVGSMVTIRASASGLTTPGEVSVTVIAP